MRIDNYLEAVSKIESVAQRFEDSGNYEKAKRLFSHALLMREQLQNKQEPEFIEALFNLGLLAYALNQFEEAESLLLRCLALERNALPPGAPGLQSTVNALTAIQIEKFSLRKNKGLAKPA